MKTFQIKDLMVSLSTTANATQALCLNYTIACHYGCSIRYTPIFCHLGCTFHFTPICHGGCSIVPSIHCGPTFIDWDTTTPIRTEIDNFQEPELAKFKTDLAELQKYVDQKLQRTPEELDQLETKLTEAINEVRAQKANAGYKK